VTNFRWALLLGILAAGSSSLGFPGPGLQVTLQRIDVSRLPDVFCYFTVTDARGLSVIGLTGSEISVVCDGTVQPPGTLQSAVQGGEYLAAVLLFDRSGSMKAAVDRTKEAAADFIRRLSLDDEIAVVSFDQSIRVDLPLTRDKAAGEAAVRAITPGSNTALFDAVREGLAQIQASASKRPALIVLSDGLDTKSRSGLADVAAEAKSRGVPVFTVGFGDRTAPDVLQALAGETGGRYFAASDPEDLLTLYQTIGTQLSNQYRLNFRPVFGADEAWHKLEIRVAPPGGEAPASVARDFIASIGPGVSRTVIGGFERNLADKNHLLWGGLGAAFGALLGFILGLLIKALRPDARIRSGAFLGLILISAVLGGIVGLILEAVS
jgi:VWFA-related protein